MEQSHPVPLGEDLIATSLGGLVTVGARDFS
jgi:hypothetical protein